MILKCNELIKWLHVINNDFHDFFSSSVVDASPCSVTGSDSSSAASWSSTFLPTAVSVCWALHSSRRCHRPAGETEMHVYVDRISIHDETAK